MESMNTVGLNAQDTHHGFLYPNQIITGVENGKKKRAKKSRTIKIGFLSGEKYVEY